MIHTPPPKTVVVTKLGRDMVRGPNGGTFRRRREACDVDPAGVRWLCVRVIPGREFAVADSLEGAGFRVFCPHGCRVSYQARVHGKMTRARRERDYPVFDSYLFVGEPAGLILAVWSHPHIAEIVSNAGTESVPSAFIRAACDLWIAGEWDERKEPPIGNNRLKRGDLVRIGWGPFANFEAVVRSLPSRTRAIVEMQVFGRRTSAGVDISTLKPV